MFETEFETSDSETSDSEETSLIKKQQRFHPIILSVGY